MGELSLRKSTKENVAYKNSVFCVEFILNGRMTIIMYGSMNIYKARISNSTLIYL